MKYNSINSKLFIQNRERLAKKLSPNAIAVFNSNDVMPTNADGSMGFRQNADLFYLSGIDQEESILVVFPDAKDVHHREVLFLKETNEHIAIWEGHKYTKEEAEKTSGIKTIYWLHEFSSVFKTLLFRAETVYLNTNEHTRATIETETRDARFVKWCTENFPLHNYARVAPIMHHLRAIKSNYEIELIQQACNITEKGFRRLLKFIKPVRWQGFRLPPLLQGRQRGGSCGQRVLVLGGLGFLDLDRGRQQRQARHHTIGVEAVGRRIRRQIHVGHDAAGVEGQRLELHAGRVEVLVTTTLGVDTVETAHDIVVHHVHHRLGHALADGLEGVHALLDDHVVHLQALFHHAHLVALLAVEADQLGGVLDRHDAHAVGAGVGLDHHEGLVGDAVLLVLGADAGEQRIAAPARHSSPVRSGKSIWPHTPNRVDAPGVDADRAGEVARRGRSIRRARTCGGNASPHAAAGSAIARGCPAGCRERRRTGRC